MISIKICTKNINNQIFLVINDTLFIPLSEIDFINLNANHLVKIKNSLSIHTKDEHNWIFINYHADIIREFLINNKIKVNFK